MEMAQNKVCRFENVHQTDSHIFFCVNTSVRQSHRYVQLLQDLAALSDFKLAQPVCIMKSGALRKSRFQDTTPEDKYSACCNW